MSLKNFTNFLTFSILQLNNYRMRNDKEMNIWRVRCSHPSIRKLERRGGKGKGEGKGQGEGGGGEKGEVRRHQS